MHIPHLLGATILCAGLGLLFTAGESASGTNGSSPTPPPSNGHFALVVEGDRDRLSITHASHKPDPWAGTPKGLQSTWALSIRDRTGTELQRVPLDMSQFDLQAERVGGPLRVEGCVVRDARVAMLANAPCIGGAASYVFLRGEIVVGMVEATEVNRLAGGGR